MNSQSGGGGKQQQTNKLSKLVKLLLCVNNILTASCRERTGKALMQCPVQCNGKFFPGAKWPGVKLTTHPLTSAITFCCISMA